MRFRIWGLSVSRETLLLLLAVVVGIGGALFSVLLYYLVEEGGAWIQAHAPGGLWGRMFLGFAGGIAVGGMIHLFARETKGHGVPEVMEAVARRGGRMRARVVWVKALTSALTVGTGGSAGREGPIVHIGSALGSVLGQWLRLPEERIKTLVACGAAAGISASFNAPLAGSVFALEVILGQFTATTFSMVVVAAAVADVVSWNFLGNQPGFVVPPYELVSGAELGLYALLGTVCAAVGWVFTRTLYGIEDLFERWKALPDWVKPAVGGLIFGAVGWWVPYSVGSGFHAMNEALVGGLAGTAMALLAAVKIFTSSVTLGSGGSGGTFAPCLYVGAMTGGAFGSAVHALFPAVTAEAGAYALVGMGALLAGATQAPITAILMLFELTRDYRIVIPLMLACVISSVAAGWLSNETMYTMKLARRGIRWRAGKDVTVLDGIEVREAMSAPVQTVQARDRVADLVALMQRSRFTGFPVVDEGGRLVGIVTLDDVRNTDAHGRLDRFVEEIMNQELVVAFPDESLAEAAAKMDQRDVGRLPVVTREDPRRIAGMITRSDILRAYHRALAGLRAPEGFPRPGSRASMPSRDGIA